MIAWLICVQVDKEREEEYKLGREEAVRLAQADHQAMMEQIAKDEEVATELAKTIEQQDVSIVRVTFYHYIYTLPFKYVCAIGDHS